ncbi:MAG: RNA polymerase sigma factor [Saprospiraceae bacterium]|nr:RNA polymerase sigma factor [Saprospiraceae bacterium]
MVSFEHLTDEQMIEQIKQSGSMEAFGTLYQRYAHVLLGWCLRYLKQQSDSEDAVMDIIEQLLKNINKYEIKNFRNWLFLVARNHCYQRLRGRTEILIDDLNQEKNDGADMESDVEWHLKNEKIENALHEEIENLNQEQKTCIILFYLQNKSYKEIVDTTGFQLSKVKSYIQNGKRNLRLKLEVLRKN